MSTLVTLDKRTADSDTKVLLEVVEAGITISYEICELSIV